MTRPNRRPIHLLGAFIFLLFSFGGRLYAQQRIFTFDPAQTHVGYTLGDVLHTVHGTFRLKRGFIKFDTATGDAQGLIVVDATSGDSGSDGRDHRMHKEILESDRYPEITFAPNRVRGTIANQRESQLAIEGMLTLHGAEHPVELVAHLNPGADQLSAATRFEIPYVAWGLKNPSTFILRVSRTVNIDIQASGRLLGADDNP